MEMDIEILSIRESTDQTVFKTLHAAKSYLDITIV